MMTSKTKIKLSRYAASVVAVWSVCAMLAAAGYGLFYVPQQAERIQVQKQFAESSAQLEKAHLAARDETKKQINERFEQSRRAIADFSIPADGVTNLVFQIGQIANELHLLEFSSKNQKTQYVSTVGDSKRLTEVWLTVEFFATFEQFAQFMNHLERNCPVVFMEKVFFRRGAQNSKGHEVKLELSFLAAAETTNTSIAMAGGDSAAPVQPVRD